MLDRYALNFQPAILYEFSNMLRNRIKHSLNFESFENNTFFLPFFFFFFFSFSKCFFNRTSHRIRVSRSLNQTISKESSDENNHLRKNQMPDRFYRLTQTIKLYCYSQLDLRVQMQSEHFKLLTSIPERITNSRSKQPLYSRRNNFSCRQYALASFALSTFERIRDCEFMSNAFMPIEYLTTVCVCVYLCVEGGKVARKKDRFEIFKKNESIF